MYYAVIWKTGIPSDLPDSLVCESLTTAQEMAEIIKEEQECNPMICQLKVVS